MKDLKTVLLDATSARKLLDKARSILSVLNRPEAQEARFLIDKAAGHIDGLVTYLTIGPSEMGRQGGLKTAERGPDYFRQLAAKRKVHGGGRPRKQAE